jgi:spermidine/putrescine-binding protein
MTGSHVGNTQVWGKVVTGAEIPSWMTPDQLKQTIDFLIKVKKEQALTYTDSYGEMADIFARGEAVISTMGWEPVAGWAKKKGVEVAYVYPKEGTTGFVDTYVIPKNAPNPEPAHALIDNALSAPAQVFVGNEFGQGIVNTEAVSKLNDDAKKAYPYDDMASLQERAKFYPFPPLEDDGTHATYDMIIKEWERFLRS